MELGVIKWVWDPEWIWLFSRTYCSRGCEWTMPDVLKWNNNYNERGTFQIYCSFVFWGQTHFQWECTGHFYVSIKTAIFKTLRRLDTTWNFAHIITRVSTHEHQHWEHCLCDRVFEQLSLAVACSARSHHGSREVSILECSITWRTVKVDRS